MGRLQPIEEGNHDHQQISTKPSEVIHDDHQEVSSSNDPTVPTIAAPPSPHASHPYPTTPLPQTTETIHHPETSSQPAPHSQNVPHVPSRKDDDDLDSIMPVSFPPPPPKEPHPPTQNNQLVVYAPPEPSQSDRSTTVHGLHVGQIPAATGLPRQQSQVHEDIGSITAVTFPPQSRIGQNVNNNYMPPSNNNEVVMYAPPPLRVESVGGGGGGGSVYGVPVAGGQGQQVGLAREQSQSAQTSSVLVPATGEPWKSGLFDCLQHPSNAIITTVAPCVTFGQIAEVVDNGSTSCTTGAMLYMFLFLVICHWNIGVRYRRRVRNAFGLSETPVTDRIAHVMFPLCALCQEFRELSNRGLDPYLGYRGIIAKRQHEQKQQELQIIYPPMNQIMMR